MPQGNSRGAQTANQKSATTKTIAGDAAIRGGTPMTLAISTALTKTTPTLLNSMVATLAERSTDGFESVRWKIEIHPRQNEESIVFHRAHFVQSISQRLTLNQNRIKSPACVAPLPPDRFATGCDYRETQNR